MFISKLLGFFPELCVKILMSLSIKILKNIRYFSCFFKAGEIVIQTLEKELEVGLTLQLNRV